MTSDEPEKPGTARRMESEEKGGEQIKDRNLERGYTAINGASTLQWRAFARRGDAPGP